MAEKCLELKDISKSFSKDAVVLKEISLSIDKGEFITLLGSSGCGKTTTLRIIAGLETPDSGKVYLEGKDVTALAPEARDVNTVFQNYALFPHMTVADNIGYGLKLKKIPKAEIKKRVSEMLELVQLPGYEKRKPSELSTTTLPTERQKPSTSLRMTSASSISSPNATTSASAVAGTWAYTTPNAASLPYNWTATMYMPMKIHWPLWYVLSTNRTAPW